MKIHGFPDRIRSIRKSVDLVNFVNISSRIGSIRIDPVKYELKFKNRVIKLKIYWIYPDPIRNIFKISSNLPNIPGSDPKFEKLGRKFRILFF